VELIYRYKKNFFNFFKKLKLSSFKYWATYILLLIYYLSGVENHRLELMITIEYYPLLRLFFDNFDLIIVQNYRKHVVDFDNYKLVLKNIYNFYIDNKYIFIECCNIIIQNSSDILFEELDKLEWYINIRSEVDTISEIPVDLAVKYGNEYFSNVINQKINYSRQLYYKGLPIEHSMQLPLSGLSSSPDKYIFFNFDKKLNFKSWDIKSKKIESLESYYEFNVVDIDSDYKDINLSYAENTSDYYGFKFELEYYLDSNFKFKNKIENNPSIVQDFLNWRDISNFNNSDSISKYHNLKYNKILDESIYINNKNKNQAILDNFQNQLTANSNEFLYKYQYFDDYISENSKITNINNFLYKNSGTIFDFYNVSDGLGIELSFLKNTLDSELSDIYKKIFNKNNILETKLYNRFNNKKVNLTIGLGLGGNIFINYGIFLLRNPIFDFSYKNSTSMHYDTLDKFWDKRPYTSGWLSSDIFTFGPVNSNYLKSPINLYGNFDNNNFNFGTILLEQKINNFSLINFLLSFINLSINYVIKLPGLINNFNNNVYFLTKKLIFISSNNSTKTNILREITIYPSISSAQQLGKHLKFTNHEINIIKNIKYGRAWPNYSSNFGNLNTKIAYLPISNKNIKEKLITSEIIEKILLNYSENLKINREFFIEILSTFDKLFDNGEVYVNKNIMLILYALGMIESSEFKNNYLKLTNEILLIVKLIDTMLNLNYNSVYIIRVINWILDNDVFWYEFNIFRFNNYNNSRFFFISKLTENRFVVPTFYNEFFTKNYYKYLLNTNLTNKKFIFKLNYYVPQFWNFDKYFINKPNLSIKTIENVPKKYFSTNFKKIKNNFNILYPKIYKSTVNNVKIVEFEFLNKINNNFFFKKKNTEFGGKLYHFHYINNNKISLIAKSNSLKFKYLIKNSNLFYNNVVKILRNLSDTELLVEYIYSLGYYNFNILDFFLKYQNF